MPKVKPARRAINLRFRPNELKRIKRLAVEIDRTMSSLMLEWVTQGVARAEKRLAAKRASASPEVAPVENAAA